MCLASINEKCMWKYSIHWFLVLTCRSSEVTPRTPAGQPWCPPQHRHTALSSPALPALAAFKHYFHIVESRAVHDIQGEATPMLNAARESPLLII